MSQPELIAASVKTLEIMELILRADFVDGITASQIAQDCRLTASTTTRHLATLLHSGWVEQIAATGRWRPAHRLAQRAAKILSDIQAGERRLNESRNRILKEAL